MWLSKNRRDAKLYGFSFGVCCIVMAACATGPESLATGASDCGLGSYRNISSSPTVFNDDSKAVLLRFVNDRVGLSQLTVAKQNERLQARRVTAILQLRDLATTGHGARWMREAEDSLLRIPSISESVRRIETLERMAKARRNAKADAAGEHLIVSQTADSVDYVSAAIDMGETIRDTTVELVDAVSNLYAVRDDLKGSFPQDTAFAEIANIAAATFDTSRVFLDGLVFDAWYTYNWTPQYRFISSACGTESAPGRSANAALCPPCLFVAYTLGGAISGGVANAIWTAFLHPSSTAADLRGAAIDGAIIGGISVGGGLAWKAAAASSVGVAVGSFVEQLIADILTWL